MEETQNQPAVSESVLKSAKEAFEEGTKSGYRMSLIEADKAVDYLLKTKNFPGKTQEERLKALEGKLSSYERLVRAHTKAQEIMSKLEYQLDLDSVKEHLATMNEAAAALANWPRYKPMRKLITRVRLKVTEIGAPRLVFYVATFIALELFFTTTELGTNLIVGFFDKFNELLKTLSILAAIGLGGALVIAILFTLFDRRRK